MDYQFVPDFEGHYQKLLAVLKAQANAKPSGIGGIWLALLTGGWDKEHEETNRQRAYFETMSTLPFALLYFDLPGIEPRLARVLVLARLVVDDAPIAFLREELKAAIADVIEVRETEAPVILFTERMQVQEPAAPSYLGKWLQGATTLGNA